MAKSFNELKEIYLETNRKLFNKLFVNTQANDFALDEQAQHELDTLLSENDLAAEVFQNTVGLILDEGDQLEYLLLAVQRIEITERMSEIVSVSDFESKTNEILTNFILHNMETLDTIRANSMLRRLDAQKDIEE